MPRYELVEGTSSKFWEIEITGAAVTTRWGRIGTAGQEKTKELASPAKAQAEYDSLIREKTGKGYREAGASAAPAPSVPRPAPAPPPPPPPAAAAPAPEPPGPVAPPEPPPSSRAEEPVIAWTPELRALILPRRDGEVRPVVSSDPVAAWARIRQAFAEHAPAWRSSQTHEDPDLAPVLRAVLGKLSQEGDDLPPAADPETEGALLVVLAASDILMKQALDDEIVTVWEATGGLALAVEALQASLDLDFVSRQDRAQLWLSRKRQGGGVAAHRHAGFRHWYHLRHRLAAAGAAEWEAARKTAERLRAGASLDWRVPLAFLFPETGWADEDALQVTAGWKSSLLISVVRDAGLVLQMSTSSSYGWGYLSELVGDPKGLRRALFTVVDNLGPSAVQPLVRMFDEATYAEHRQMVLDALSIVGTAETAQALAERIEVRQVAAALTAFATRFPRVALPVTAARAARGGPLLGALLSQMVQRDRGLAAELLPGLPDASRRTLEALLTTTELPPEATPGDLPPVLASPPWQRKGTRKEKPRALDLPPLPCEETMAWPEEMEESWRQEGFMNREILSDRHKARLGAWEELDDAALRSLVAKETEDIDWAWASSLAGHPPRLALALWETFPPNSWFVGDLPLRFLAEQQLRALPGLLRYAGSRLADAVPLCLPFRSPRLAPLLAEAMVRLKKLRAEARLWLLLHDECALVGLIPVAVGPAGKRREMAEAALRFLAAQDREEMALDVAGRWGDEAREAVRAVLATDRRDLFPARLPKMPSFWQPDGFARPLLRGRSGSLPLAAVEALGTMLAFTSLEEPYAGLDEVREACDPASLASFAWDLFSAWLAAGAPAKEQWAFLALGHLGDDGTARRLAPLIREWPGEGAHARAVAGLDVLRAIGTDVALMHLHGISLKVKFKGLQDKAKEKIEEVAEQRGLTPEDLADRLVPDLGLEPDGSLVLDFGPRSFRIAFDESLKPFVRDGEGKRLGDLPKPGKADDAEKAGKALETWKTLKKDAKALAAQQILRLELAMCSRRRWEPDVFRAFFLEHPLLQHLVRRLVWGTWDGEERLTGTFRVSEDGSLADAADEAWELPDGVRAGIVHRLDLDDALAARWGEVFSDYEILQPFAQLGRDLYRITEEEREARELRRLEGITVPTGKVLGLVDRRGWRRGPALDGGGIWWFAKPLPGDREARLALDPGITVGMVMDEPVQKLGTVTIQRSTAWDTRGELPFGQLGPILFSELVRDLEELRG